MEMSTPFPSPCDAALALFNSGQEFSWKQGGFIGHMFAADRRLSDAQEKFFGDLLLKSNLPPLAF